MKSSEGENILSISEVATLGDEWGFTLYDIEERELCALSFEAKSDAKKAHKALKRATAISPPEGFHAIVRALVVKRRR